MLIVILKSHCKFENILMEKSNDRKWKKIVPMREKN